MPLGVEPLRGGEQVERRRHRAQRHRIGWVQLHPVTHLADVDPRPLQRRERRRTPAQAGQFARVQFGRQPVGVDPRRTDQLEG